jgi:hypothetical protein
MAGGVHLRPQQCRDSQRSILLSERADCIAASGRKWKSQGRKGTRRGKRTRRKGRDSPTKFAGLLVETVKKLCFLLRKSYTFYTLITRGTRDAMYSYGLMIFLRTT